MAEARKCAVESKQRMCICRFSTDVLQNIMRHLSIIDYIKCLAASKCWRSAFLLSSKKTYFRQAHQRRPWFLLLDTNDSLEHTRFFRATSKLGNMADERTIYDSNMPELRGTYVLLSQYGWMLLYSSRALFFFHIFSRTRIDIPFVNVAEMRDAKFEITAPPTSPDCVLFSTASYGNSNPYRDSHVKCWRCKDLSWNLVPFKSFVHKRSYILFGVSEEYYSVNANRGYNVIDVANGNRKPVSEGSHLSRREKESLKAILVEPTGLSLPPA